MIMGGRGMGMKSGDDTAVPLCHPHHMMLHAGGNEYRFWDRAGVDPVEWAETSYKDWKDNKDA